MTKKLAIGALVVVLIGAVAVATMDLLGSSASADNGQQHGRSEQVEGRGNGAQESEEGTRQGNGWGAAGRDEGKQGGPLEEQSEDQRGSDAAPEPLVEVEDWETFEGTVAVFDDEGLTISLADGQEVAIEMGPSWYWQDQAGFSAEIGDEVTVTGFFEDDEFVVGSITNHASGQETSLRTDGGRPMWAGRSRGGRR